MAECCGAEAPAIPTASAPAGKPDTSEGEAKAHEYNEKQGQAKQEAQAAGTPVGPEPAKPAAPPAPTTKAPAPVDKAQTGAQEPAKKTPDGKASTHPPSGKAAPASGGAPAGPAAATAQASVAADVAEFFKKSPKDPAKTAVNGNVAQILEAAQSLMANCPPIGAKKEEKEEGNLDKIGAAFGKSPYDGMNLKYQKWIEFLSRLRDLFSGISGILGTVGIVLSVLGLLISLTGIGAPLGAPIEVIGNVITVICLILDGTSTIMSGIVQGLVMASAAAEKNPDPERRKKLGELINKEAQNTASSLVSFVMNLPIVGKLAELGLSKIGGLIKGLLGGIGKGIAAAVGPLAKRVFAALKKLFTKGEGAAVKAAEGAAVKAAEGAAEKGAIKAAEGAAEKGATKAAEKGAEEAAVKAGEKAADKAAVKAADGAAEKGATKAAEDAAKKPGWLAKQSAKVDSLRGKVNSFLEQKLDKFAETGAGKAFNKAGKMADKALNAGGGEAIEGLGKKLDYYTDKASNKFADWAKKKSEKLFSTGAQDASKAIEGAAAKDAESAVAKGAESGASKTAAAEGEKAETSAAESAAKTEPKPEAKPTETPPEAHPTDEKPPEAKPTEAKGSEANGDDAKGSEGKGSEAKPDEKPPEAKPADAKADDKATTAPPANDKPGYDGKPQTKAEAKELAEKNANARKLRGLEAEEKTAKDTIAKVEKDNKAVLDAEKEVHAIEQRHVNDGGMTPKDIKDYDAAQDKLHQLLEDKKNAQALADYHAAEKKLTGVDAEKKEMEEAAELKKRLDAGVKGDYKSEIDPATGKPKNSEFADASGYEKPHGVLGDSAALYANGKSLFGGPGTGASDEVNEELEKQKKEKELKELVEKGNSPAAQEARKQAMATPAPKLSGTASKGATAGRVDTLLAGVGTAEQHPAAPAAGPDAQGGADHPGQGAAPSDPTPAPPAPAPAPSSGAGGGDAGGAGGGAAAGAIPYWPELLQQYSQDLGKLATAKEQLVKYKQEQLAGYEQAVGIEQGAAKAKGEAEARKAPASDNEQQSAKDKSSLDDMADKNKVAGGKTTQASDKQQSATGESSKAESQPTEVPPPPEQSWWGKLKNALNVIKNYILGLLAKGMAWIQNGITTLVLKATGVDPKVIKQFTDCAGGNAAVDAAAAEEGGKQTKEGSDKDKKNEADAEKGMSEAQKLQHQTQGNINSADQLLASIAQAQTLLQGEIQKGSQYMSDVNSAVAAEKAKDHQEEEKKKKASKDSHHKGGPGGAGGDHHDDHSHDKKKDLADPMQVARVKQAAQIVREADTANAAKIQGWLAEGANNLQCNPVTKANPEAYSDAHTAFTGGAGKLQTQYMAKVQARSTQLSSVAGKGSMSSTEVVTAANTVEHAAADSDSDFETTAAQLEAEYEGNYDALSQCAMPTGADVAPTAAMA